MQRIDGKLVYSASDLVGYLACQHLTALERAAMDGHLTRPMRRDAELERIEQRGLQHEARFLETLRAQGKGVTDLDVPRAPVAEGAARTLEAMRRGDDVIYQGTLFDGGGRGDSQGAPFAGGGRGDSAGYQGTLLDGGRGGGEVVYQGRLFGGEGHGDEAVRQGRLFDVGRLGGRLGPDFLIRVERPSKLGAWSYEPWDTKLARHVKGSAVLQLCFYADLLTDMQGVAPEHLYVALGGSMGEPVKLRYADFSAYYRLVKGDFERTTAGAATWPLVTRPDPVEHCEVCRWNEECRKKLRADDDLSLVAGISSHQRRLLRERGIDTRTGLAGLTLPLEPPLEGNARSWQRVREQARIQVEGQAAGKLIHELLDPPRLKDGSLEPEKGLLALPEPSPGDLFFDMEGDPFALDEGVDYLFGVLEPGRPDAKGEPTFHAFWSIDDKGEVTSEAERAAFEKFMDLVKDRLERDPNLHIYHYHHYEPTAVKRLMGRYGTREEEVDRLLRSGVFVDLHRAVRQGIRASVEGYSIKNLEELYDFKRTVDLRDAGSSIAAFEEWLELGGDAPDAPGILERILGYNKDDCTSNWRLRDWLEEQRKELAAKLGADLPRPEPRSADPNEGLAQELSETEELMARLTEGVPAVEAERTPEQQAQWLLAQLLAWHRREDKSFWWRHYYLMNELTDEERVEESDALGNLEPLGPVRQEKRSTVYAYRFPPQEHKIDAGDKNRDPATGKSAGQVVFIDDASRTIEIKRGNNSDKPDPRSLLPFEHFDTASQRRSLREVGKWVADHGIDAPGEHRAVRDLLLRRRPRSEGDSGEGPLVLDGESAADAARRIVGGLQASCLPIQGPPGSGKTTVGAEMIVDLVAAGKRVGVTANSHKVIGNLLDKVVEKAKERGVKVIIGQKGDTEGEPTCKAAVAMPNNAATADALAAGEVHVVGGTSWLWSSQEMQGAVDVLFVDEAGQMSLANVVACSQGATSLVLLGDPQQLDQPLKGCHPPGADRSALAHVLGEHPTMPEDLGIFLDGTWRLHPDICAYTSEAFYEGKLHPWDGRERQVIDGAGPLSGAGIRFVPVAHAGHSNESEEEAEAVARLVSELLASEPSWTNEKGETKPLRLDDVLVVAPYNAHVGAIRAALDGIDVGTVDKFQGREAPVSIYSMATSSAGEAPRGMEFLYSLNRLNVATSRARCVAAVVASPDLLRVHCKTPRQMRLVNALARFVELAGA